MSLAIPTPINNLSSYKAFALLLLSSLVLRFLSFHFSIIDHDETTYVIMADAILNGANLYTDVIDTKPPGIFIAVGIIQLLFGKSFIALRVVASVFVADSGFLIYLISKFLTKKNLHSFFAGITYVVLFSLYRFGLSVNTELFFSFFTLLGFYILLKNSGKKQILYWLLGGFSIGVAFIFKYVVLAGFGALSIFFLWNGIKNKTSIIYLILKLGLATIGVFLPFILVHLYYYEVGRFEDFYSVIYTVTGNYSSTFSWAESFSFFFKFLLMYIPFVVFYIAGATQVKSFPKLIFLSLLWFSFAWVMVILPGKSFKHYFLQLLPAFSLLIPFGFEKLLLNRFQVKNSKIIKGSLILLFLIAVVNQSYFWTNTDVSREIAAELEEKVESTDYIWTDKKLHAIYYLLNLRPPTKYVHPTLMFDHAEAFGINPEIETNSILDKKPKYIVYHKSAAFFESNSRIKAEYHFYKKVEKATILERNF